MNGRRRPGSARKEPGAAGPEPAAAKGIRPAPPRRRRPLAESILRLIWRERRISRAEIARRTRLSRSTVSEIVGLLLPTGLVEEVGVGPSAGGRPPIVLEFKDDAFAILGVEMGATHVTAVLTDLRGGVLDWQQESHPVRTDPEGTRALIVKLCDACLAARPHGMDRLVGIGIAVPSPVDPRHPDLLSEVVLPEWQGRSGLTEILAPYGVPVFIDNDANLGALAERWWGAGRGVDNFAYVKVATGVGSGHVIGGKIYRGASGVAGEIGHMAIDPHGGPCICGLRGCLATLVGGPALVGRARALIAEYPVSRLSTGAISVDAIVDAALDRDPLALRLVQEAAEYLGIAVAGLLNLMNPSVVIFGGELARSGDALLAPLRETIRLRTLLSSLIGSEVRASALGPRASAIGAATLVLEAALSDMHLFPPAPQAREAV